MQVMELVLVLSLILMIMMELMARGVQMRRVRPLCSRRTKVLMNIIWISWISAVLVVPERYEEGIKK